MDKKKIANHINSALPTVFSNVAKILKDNFDTNGQEIIGDSTGTAAIIAKLIGQPAIDKYFENLTDKKLDNHGLNIYLKTGFLQASESLDEIKEHLNNELAPESIFSFLNQGLELERNKFNSEELILIFKPKYHPAIISIKRHYEYVLAELGTPIDAIRRFTQHFNDHIEAKVDLIRKDRQPNTENPLKSNLSGVIVKHLP